MDASLSLLTLISAEQGIAPDRILTMCSREGPLGLWLDGTSITCSWYMYCEAAARAVAVAVAPGSFDLSV